MGGWWDRGDRGGWGVGGGEGRECEGVVGGGGGKQLCENIFFFFFFNDKATTEIYTG